MTVVISAVGAGDLGVDVVKMDREERRKAVDALERRLEDRVTAPDTEAVAKMLLEGAGDGRFSVPPVTLLLNSIEASGLAGGGAVRVLLLDSKSGDQSTHTDSVAKRLEEAYGLSDVQKQLESRYGFKVEVEAIEADLREKVGVEALEKRVRELGEAEYVVNGISGASMIVFAAMGLLDELACSWRLAVAPGEGKEAAHLLEVTSHKEAAFYWLRSMGYLDQAQRFADGLGAGARLVDDQHRDIVDLSRRLREGPEHLSFRELGRLLALDMARADGTAGLLARPWVEAAYREKNKQEGVAESGPDNLFSRASSKDLGGKNTLGAAIGRAKKVVEKGGSLAPESAKWLAGLDVLNNIGKKSVHDLAEPLLSEARYVLQDLGLGRELPDWVSRPGERPVLYIVPCGTMQRGEPVPQRVLLSPVPPALKAAVPGGLLSDGLPLEVEFLFLHSKDQDSVDVASKNVSEATQASACQDWRLVAPEPAGMACYGGADKSEYLATPDIMKAVSAQVSPVLEEKCPTAVVLVGTGQKAVVYGALEAAQKWCADHGAPLFLQTFVDGVRAAPQFHRVSLHRDTRKALLEVAKESLARLDLLSAVRVLEAGDGQMHDLAERCSKLRQKLLHAANNDDAPDEGAAVLMDLLEVVAHLWESATDELVKMRLMVVVAEALDFGRNRALLVRAIKDNGNGGWEQRRFGSTDGGACADAVEASHRDLLDLLYRVRSNLVVTHGSSAGQEAFRYTVCFPFGEGKRGAPEPFFCDYQEWSYPAVLRLTKKKLLEGAAEQSINLTASTWKQDFDKLSQDLETKLQ